MTDRRTQTSSLSILIIWILISCILLLTNLTEWNQFIFKGIDAVLNPFLINTRNSAIKTSNFFKELNDRPNLIQENLNLKKQIHEFEGLRVVNKDLEDQLSKLEAQTNISTASKKKFKLVKIVGTQNAFTSDPFILMDIGSDSKIKPEQAVYYNENSLVGFVKDINGNTGTIIPFYSAKNSLNVPVQNLRDPKQKGFVSAYVEGSLKIRNIIKDADVREGDIWITSSEVEKVPANLIIGKTTKVNRDSKEGFLEVEIELLFNFSDTQYLLLEE